MDEGACTRSLRCGHSYGSGDRYGGEAFVGQKRRFVLSAVGHTSAAGDNLILSALRRKLGQGGTVAVTVSVSQCSGINSSSSSGRAIHSEQGGVAGDAPVSNSFTVESLIQPDAKAEMELGCVGDVEDVKFELAVVADPLKRESFMREALLATRLKNRKLLRQS